MAGTMIKPPPTPIIADKMPTPMPTTMGGITEIYRPDVRNFIFSGSASIQLRFLRFGAGAPPALLARRKA